MMIFVLLSAVFGEPLTHPDIVEFVGIAKKAGIFGVNIETDGLNLTADICSQLISAGVDVLTVHLDGWNESTWAKTKGRRGLFW